MVARKRGRKSREEQAEMNSKVKVKKDSDHESKPPPRLESPPKTAIMRVSRSIFLY